MQQSHQGDNEMTAMAIGVGSSVQGAAEEGARGAGGQRTPAKAATALALPLWPDEQALTPCAQAPLLSSSSLAAASEALAAPEKAKDDPSDDRLDEVGVLRCHSPSLQS